MSDYYGALVTNNLNKENQERAYQQQRQLNYEAREYNTMMWHMNNAYNSPEAQMQRFKSAGLNPNLIYGQLNQGLAAPTISAGSAPSPAQAPSASMLETAQIGLINAQKENLDAQTHKTLSETDKTESEKNKIEQDIQFEAINQRLREKQAQANINLTDEQRNLVAEEVKKTAEETKGVTVDNLIKNLDREYLEKSMDDRINYIKSQIGLNNAQAKALNDKLEYEIKLLKKQAQEIEARTDLTRAQKDKMLQDKETDLIDNVYLYAAEEHFKNGKNFRGNLELLRHYLTHFFQIGKIR